MKRFLAVAALAVLASPAAAQTVDVGRANWSAMPSLNVTDADLPMDVLVTAVEDILKTKQCKLEGQSYQQFDITVPYAVLLEPDGTTSRVVVGEVNCAPIETLVGRIALERSNLGHYQPTGLSRARWHADKISFVLQ